MTRTGDQQPNVVGRAIARFRGMSSGLAVAVACACLIVMILSSACGLPDLADRPKTGIIAESKSPDGATKAIIADRFVSMSGPHRVYLIVAPSNESVAKAMKEPYPSKYLKLLVQGTAQMDLTWQDNSTLIVSCGSCNMRPDQVHRLSSGDEAIHIVYRGFPEPPRNPQILP